MRAVGGIEAFSGLNGGSRMSRMNATSLGNAGLVVVMVIGCTVVSACSGLLYGAWHQKIVTDTVYKPVGETYTGPSLGEIGLRVGTAGAVMLCGPFCWCLIKAHRRLGGWRLIGWGAAVGMVSGSLIALLIHAVIVMFSHADRSIPHLNWIDALCLAGSLGGAMIGAVLGAIGGRLADVPLPAGQGTLAGASA